MKTPQFQMSFDLGNDAFAGAQLDRSNEISRLLRETADKIDTGEIDGTLLDINGNSVGHWGFDQIDPEAEAA